jgi:hypothetical protein
VFNGSGALASIAAVTPFDLLSTYATAAWRDNLQLETIGYRTGTVVFDTTNILSASNPTLLIFNYYDVDRVAFITTNGTVHGYNGSGYEVVLDDIVAVTHPEPMITTQVQDVKHEQTETVIAWTAQLGQTYQVQYRSNLTGSPWRDVGIPITGTTATIVTTNSAHDSQGYYRLQLLR